MATHRGFQDEFYHDEHIIDQWNRVVNKRDTVYLLGDVTMEKQTNYDILDRLEGRINVVLGNHDETTNNEITIDKSNIHTLYKFLFPDTTFLQHNKS